MTTIFPTNNLPTSSQPWAREVQKQLSNVITSNNSELINNTARDNQINSSVIALSGVVGSVSLVANQAAQAIAGLTGLGSTGSGYTLNADNINGGTITGVTFRTAASGTRVELVSTRVNFHGPFGLLAGYIVGGGDDREGTLYLSGGSNSNILISNGKTEIVSGSAFIDVGNSGNNDVVISAGNRFLINSTHASLNDDGRLNVLGGLQSVYNYNNAVGGAARDLYITSAGNLGTIASSIKVKEEINLAEFSTDSIFSIEPKTFKFKVDIEEFGRENAITTVGFIAEEMHDSGLTYFVDYGKNGEVEGISYSRYVVALQAAVRNLNNRVKELENGA
jgi:hypothetical protein